MPSRTSCSLWLLASALLLPCATYSQIADSEPGIVAGIPVNYTEANVGGYTLPDPLKLNTGQMVTDAATWFAKRRPLGGKAIRRQITVYFTKDPMGPRMDLLLYLPANAKGPVPLFLNMSFFANNLAVDDTGIKVGRRWDRESQKQVPATPRPVTNATGAPAPRRPRGFPVEAFIENGIGVATFNKDDLAPDFVGSEGMGVKALYLKPEQEKPASDEWGAIAAWAWGASRALDYLETDKDVDAKRVVIHGVSRLGKTALWAGAADERFAMAVASCSGEGGAAIARRNYGETLAHMAAPTRFNYQFAGNYASYATRVNEWPVDANMLLAMIAPRPLLLQTGNTDKWSDPYGEFLAAVAVEPVYQLLGKRGLETTKFPSAGEPILHDIGYLMHDGGHGTIPSDFDVYIRFLKLHLM